MLAEVRGGVTSLGGEGQKDHSGEPFPDLGGAYLNVFTGDNLSCLTHVRLCVCYI